ncbi:hypothetical protein CTAYLR_003954 [Chrysophaeum taylorii]|uniref:Uncharacterized protein n=1 Tax=Chrysophaeum taylorii TaxID=2483200 RepID=A0AAD7UEM8_9STRA|nr:hypothetical protein CTAYLR_003954 [Chrysophaeum taylorii]
MLRWCCCLRRHLITLRGSDVPRVNIGIFGAMNAGKSSLMNALTRQNTSIVDATPGTTADTKIALHELHDVGPTKLFDTAGIDEEGELGAKKRAKSFSILKECDLALIVVDLSGFAEHRNNSDECRRALAWERRLAEEAASRGILPLFVLNAKATTISPVEAGSIAAEAKAILVEGLAAKGGTQQQQQYAPEELADAPFLVVDLGDPAAASDLVTNFVQTNAERVEQFVPRALPEKYLRPDAGVFLNIPMDAETPSMRLLRPQALVQEEAIRHWATTVAFRMDLASARGRGDALEAEKRRFQRALRAVIEACPPRAPKILVTDSQALDIVHPWTLDDSTGEPLVDVTTFSVAMMHRQSGARLPLFAKGMDTYETLKPGARILMAEACNHNRITDKCNDVGTVQIPSFVHKQHRAKNVTIDHAFGREFPDVGLSNYDLIVHCGACMIDHQKVRARISDAADAGVPITNYGLLLAYAYHGRDALHRVLDPWTPPDDTK